MLVKSHISPNVPQETAERVLAAIDNALTASTSTDRVDLTRECLHQVPFPQATVALEISRRGQPLVSFSMDNGPVAYMTCTCEARGLIFSVRVSIFHL